MAGERWWKVPKVRSGINMKIEEVGTFHHLSPAIYPSSLVKYNDKSSIFIPTCA